MDFELSDEQRLLRDTVRDFARQEVAPVAEELDRTKAFPYELVEKMGELGLMGIPFPEQYGGGGADTLAYALAVEELTRVDSSVAITMAAHTSLGTMPIALWGSDEQKDDWLPALCSGKKLAAFGLTEPEAGSDAGNTKTQAKLDGGEWVVNGAKQFITNAGTEISGCVTITAVTGAAANGDREISNLIVPNGTPGYEPGEPYRKMGWNASDTRPLIFEDCRVPEGNLLGRRGDGFKQFLQILDGGRIGVAAMGVGLAQGALDEAISYAKERQRLRPADLQVPGDPGEDRRHLRPDRGGAAARLPGGDPEGAGRALHPHRRSGEADHRPARGAGDRGGGPDPRRLRLHRGVSGLPLLPRREDPHDRRGHRRGPADGDRQAARLLTALSRSGRRH